MDVISLLNANSLAVEQQRKENDREEKKAGAATKTLSRNRTPWDAGGYSLPVNTTTTPSTSPKNEELRLRDSESTPTSPRHKFSDSRSSLSSFTSSQQSASHSRFSSLSTVGSTNPPFAFTEALLSTPGAKTFPLDFGHISRIDENQSNLGYPRHGGSISPTGSLDTLALVAENEMAGQQVKHNAEAAKASLTIEEFSKGEYRPRSPSDAVLIKRATVPSLRLGTGEQELNGLRGLQGLEQVQQNNHFLSTQLEGRHKSMAHAKSHKRALSAPDVPALVNGFMTGFTMSDNNPSMTARAEPIPPSSHHPDRTSPTNISAYISPDTPPPNTHGEILATQTILCMYIPNCDTGSQLRKAISHIFGRNKMCTRLIPAEVWVHYCRKHYQRSRYRNPKEYAKLQCDLVQQQIRRVHEWSAENLSKGLPGVVKDWGLAVRKREQKRLDDLNGAKKRNAHAAFDDNVNSDEEVNGRTNTTLPATAVPDWLLQECGNGYSTHKILEIFNRLHTEILADTMPCFPDIEILPNIAVDGEEPKSPKGYTRRNSTVKGHTRSQSLSVAAMKPNSFSQDRRMSQPVIWNQGGGYFPQAQKKRRANGMSETDSSDSSFSPYSRSRLLERQPQTGYVAQLPHRSMFPNISENCEEERYSYDNRYSHAAVPLPAPTPQRSGGQSMAAHLEMGNAPSGRRSTHQRSHSDMSAFSQGTRGCSQSPSMSSGYSVDSNHYAHNNYNQGFAAHRAEIRQGSRFYEMQAQLFSHGPSMHHGRHQSMSMVPSSAMYSAQMSSAYHPQATQYQTSVPVSRTRVMEAQQVHNLYADRR
ncbi:ORP1 like protein [Diplocarpon rosae]|nr:ORP1 like protein [Diplocarpon rosae]